MSKVDFITTNEQHVRLEIHEGRLPIDEAGAELLRIEKSQRAVERARYEDQLAACDRTIAELKSQLRNVATPKT